MYGSQSGRASKPPMSCQTVSAGTGRSMVAVVLVLVLVVMVVLR
jgi:hypothetical protein